MRSKKYQKLEAEHLLDEAKHAGEQVKQEVRFQRIDADLTSDMKEENEDLKTETEELTALFRKALGNDKLEVRAENLKDEDIASMLTVSEESRRMQEMMKMYGMGDMGQDTPATLVLNARNPLVKYILENPEGENTDLFCRQIYDLAAISHRPLKAEEMSEFVRRSNQIMMLLAK